jgi:hypothetical protein
MHQHRTGSGQGYEFSSIEKMAVKFDRPATTIKDRIRKLKVDFNDLAEDEKEKLIFSTTYPEYLKEHDKIKNGVKELLLELNDKKETVRTKMVVQKLESLLN